MQNSLINTVSEITGDGHVLTIQPGGNHGDTLIYLGMRKLLDRDGLSWKPLTHHEIRDDSPREYDWFNPPLTLKALIDRWTYFRHRLNGRPSAVYIHGGGNFNDFWGGGIRCLNVVASIFDCPILVGPQSVHFKETDPTTLFQNITNDVYFFCREEYSRNIMQTVKASNLVHIGLDDDTAVHLSPENLGIEQVPGEYSLLAFRNDKESASPRITRMIESPVRVQDVSITKPDFEGFVEAVAGARKIHTDRLHVALLGGIYQKDIVLYDNIYHKNRGVYEYTLKGNQNIEFEYLR